MITLEQITTNLPDFSGRIHVEKIKFFGWFLHENCSKPEFSTTDIRNCYDQLHLEQPSNVASLLNGLASKKPKELLKTSTGYRLARQIRDEFQEKYGGRSSTIIVTNLLEELPARVPNLQEKTFLNEALICFRHGAFRAAIVMAWNLAFHHLLCHITSDSSTLARFNSGWTKRYQGHHKNGNKSVSSITNIVEELREREIIEICNTAGLISSEIYKILLAKLDRRNSAAHPSGVIIERLQTEEFIDDLVKNVVLGIK